MTVEQVAGRIAHQINNPAAFVTTNLELAALELQELGARRRDLERDLSKALARVTECLGEARRIGAVVRELTDLSLGAWPELESTDVNAIIRRACAGARERLGGRSCVELTLGVLPPIFASPRELEQVMVQLVANSCEAITSAGREDGRLEVSSEPQGDTIVVRVRDNGCGISKGARRDVFRPHRGTAPAGPRPTHGLEGARSVARRHGGELVLGSSEHGDTTFKLILPSPLTNAPSAPPHEAAGANARPRVLLIDDDPQVLTSFTKLIELDHDVVAVDGARAALEQLARPGEPFDVILCDMMMPQLDGVDFWELLGLEPALAHLRERIIFVSGGTFTERARAFLADGAVTLLAKPFRRQHLLAAIAAKRRA